MPKTGSTAIEMALRPTAGLAITDPPIVKHTPVYRFQRFLKPYLEACGAEEMETMAVMRNPVDWLGSWYRYRARDGLRGHANSTAEMSFDDFVRGYLKKQRPPFAAVGSQAKFLQDKHGRLAVTHLFRYEDQDGIRGFLERKFNKPLTLKRLNASPVMELSLLPRMRERLREEAAQEFEVYEGIRAGGAYVPPPGLG